MAHPSAEQIMGSPARLLAFFIRMTSGSCVMKMFAPHKLHGIHGTLLAPACCSTPACVSRSDLSTTSDVAAMHVRNRASPFPYSYHWPSTPYSSHLLNSRGKSSCFCARDMATYSIQRSSHSLFASLDSRGVALSAGVIPYLMVSTEVIGKKSLPIRTLLYSKPLALWVVVNLMSA